MTRKRRSRKIALPGGEAIPQPAGKGRRTDLEPKEDATSVALAARVKMTGCAPDDAKFPANGDGQMGACINHVLGKGERAAQCREIWNSMTAAWWAYSTRVLGKSPSPQGAGLVMMPDATEVDPSLRIDARTAEEKDAAAKRVWSHWVARINAIPDRPSRIAVRGHAQGILATPWDAQAKAPTSTGRACVNGLAAMARNG